MDHQIIRLEHYASLFHFWGFGGLGQNTRLLDTGQIWSTVFKNASTKDFQLFSVMRML